MKAQLAQMRRPEPQAGTETSAFSKLGLVIFWKGN